MELWNLKRLKIVSCKGLPPLEEVSLVKRHQNLCWGKQWQKIWFKRGKADPLGINANSFLRSMHKPQLKWDMCRRGKIDLDNKSGDDPYLWIEIRNPVREYDLGTKAINNASAPLKLADLGAPSSPTDTLQRHWDRLWHGWWWSSSLCFCLSLLLDSFHSFTKE